MTEKLGAYCSDCRGWHPVEGSVLADHNDHTGAPCKGSGRVMPVLAIETEAEHAERGEDFMTAWANDIG